MNKDDIVKFSDIIKEIEENGVDVITRYSGPAFANMIRSHVQAAIEQERVACAAIAECFAEPPATAVGRGDQIGADPVRRETALEIAQGIRERGMRR